MTVTEPSRNYLLRIYNITNLSLPTSRVGDRDALGTPHCIGAHRLWQKLGFCFVLVIHCYFLLTHFHFAS